MSTTNAERCKRYKATHPGEHYERIKATRLADPRRHSAYQKVRKAIKAGRLIKKACEICGDPKSHAHHEDYSKPLEVKWLCALCHKQAHLFSYKSASESRVLR